MRYLEPDELLDAVADALENVVVPELRSPDALGQAWAAIGILRNLASRVTEPADRADLDRAIVAARLAAARAATGGATDGATDRTIAGEATDDWPSLRRDVYEAITALAGASGPPERLLAWASALESAARQDRAFRRPTHINRALAAEERSPQAGGSRTGDDGARPDTVAQIEETS